MKALRFSFEHPVKGKLRLRPLSAQMNASCSCHPFDTCETTELSIPLTGLAAGRWELTLEWEHEDRYYQHLQQVEIGSMVQRLFKSSKYAEASLFRSRHQRHATSR